MKTPHLTALALALFAVVYSPNTYSETNAVAGADSAVLSSNSETLAENLCANYSKIKTLSCEIRKTTKGGGHSLRMLSRVHYKYPNHIHVDNITPVERTIIADGKNLYFYQDGIARGFSRPISELSDMWLKSLHNIPGTAMEHLLSLKGLKEDQLPSSEKDIIRCGYSVKNIYVVISADTKNRLHQIEFFKSSAMQEKTGKYVYSNHKEVAPGCIIATHYNATLYLPAEEVVKESQHISNISVNNEIPDRLFDYELFLKDVEFTNDFKKTYE